MSYIVLRPHSVTNPTEKHQVVKYDDWIKSTYSAIPTYTPKSEHTTAEAAQDAADQLNAQEGTV